MLRFLTLCVCLLLGNYSFAQDKAGGADQALLWKISGKGLQQPSYLFGTIHLICKADYVWTPAMEQALKDAKKVALEIDMDDPALQQQLAGEIMLTGRTLKDLYTAEDYKALSEYAAKYDLPLAMLQQFKPFAIMSLTFSKLLSCDAPSSYEGNITEAAQQRHVEVVGLESVKDQVAVLDGMNEDSTAHDLYEMIVHMDSARADYNKLVAAYSKQDLPGLYELLLESPDYKGDLNALLFDRNRKWIPAIEALAKKQSTFVAVGAGHLWGDKGVIALLRKQGYTVTPVRAQP